MRPNRLFIPQAVLDEWLSRERIEVIYEEMVTRPEGRRFSLATAVLFKAEVTGSEDLHQLVGKVKDLDELKQIEAEHQADSVILGDNAYEVVEGFAGTPVADEHTELARGSDLASATRAAVGDENGDELDALAELLKG